MSEQFEYVGSELDLFSSAHNWKNYYGGILQPFLGEDVLEVGAGIGGTTPYLITPDQLSWLALEPDPELAARAEAEYQRASYGDRCSVSTTKVADLPAEQRFKSILYIDVLEHIEDDKTEAGLAAQHLAPGGRLIVLAPAHQSLYSAFDEAIGHYRRYSVDGLKRLSPQGLELERAFYLDSVGMLASLGNRMLLKSAMPTASQIAFWDKVLVPLSRIADKILLRRIGKTAIAIWRLPI